MFYIGAHKGDAVRSICVSLNTCSVLEEFCSELQNSQSDSQAEAPAPCSSRGRAVHPAQAKLEHVAAGAGAAQPCGLQPAPSLQLL